MMSYNRKEPYNDLPDLPPAMDAETITAIVGHALKAARSLAELKGLCETMTAESLMNLLVNTIILQESRDSSAIENIVTTQDELYQAATEEEIANPSAKEVFCYREALYAGMDFMKNHHGLITTNLMEHVVQKINMNNAGVRRQAGTALKNAITGDIVYTPPCCEDVIRKKLRSLEVFINDPEFFSIDPIIKMSMMHYQFETIHPFSDGNGRTGRILNSLYLAQQNLLPQPVLYLSSYIVEHKQDYYRLLREVTEQNNWHDWILFMTTAINSTAHITMNKIRGILHLKEEMETEVFDVLKSFNNKEALYDLMFSLPYLKIELLTRKNVAHRETASLYLKKLADANILRTKKIGRTTYYTNYRLIELLIH
jgi:Fic family protein